MKKVIVLLVLCFAVSSESFSQHFFYDLEDDSSNERSSYHQNKNTIKKKANKKTVKTCKMYTDDSPYEVKPYKPEKKKEIKHVTTKKASTNNDDIKYLIRENSRLIRENTKLSNELKRIVEENTKAIADLNKRLDEYEKN